MSNNSNTAVRTPKRRAIGDLIRNNTTLTQGIAQQLDDTHSSEGVQRTIGIDSVSLNPNNPRHQIITKERMIELADQQKKEKPLKFLSKKEEEFFYSIASLADTIKNNGLIHQVLIEEKSGSYFIVAGYRRFLAHILLHRKTIRSTVKQATDELQRDLTAFIENMSREDLSLAEQIGAIQSIVSRYQLLEKKKISVRELAALVGISATHAQRMKTIIEGDDDLLTKVLSGEIESFRDYEKAAKDKLPPPPPVSEKNTDGPKRYSVRSSLSQKGLQKLFDLVGLDSTNIDWSNEKAIKEAWSKLTEKIEGAEGNAT